MLEPIGGDTATSTTQPAGSTVAHAHRLFAFGVAVTLVYVSALGAYSWFARHAMLKMEPDEFATFLSGVFAPLAFLWLVLGFKQQGDELKNSAQALWLQGEELRNSVEQQRQLVEVQREQLASDHHERTVKEREDERRAQPQLAMGRPGGSYSGTKATFRFTLSSGGPACLNLNMAIDGTVVGGRSVFSPGETLEAKRTYEPVDKLEPVTIDLTYVDERGNSRSQAFYFPVQESAHGKALGEPIRRT